MFYDKELVKLLIQDHFKKPVSEVIKDKKFIPFISYTTRLKRECETEGVEHYFITDEQADEIIKDKEKILAYTVINNCKYFTLTDQMIDHNVYIIDPNGIKDVQERHPNIKLNIYYIGCSFNNRYRRYMQRLGLECTAKICGNFSKGMILKENSLLNLKQVIFLMNLSLMIIFILMELYLIYSVKLLKTMILML